MTKVFRYRVYDASRDDYAESTRMATRAKIRQIGGEVIRSSKTEVDDKHLDDGWTAKGFVEKLAADQMNQTRSGHESGSLPRSSSHATQKR
jgi:hypothetical protein